MTGAADTGSIAIANVVLGVVPVPTTTTTGITFTPPLGQGTYLDDAVLTIGPQELNIKLGDGNLTYTEHRDYTYLLDRGWLDTVREPKEVPMDVKVDAVYEHVASRSGELVTPVEALDRGGTRVGVGQFLARSVRTVLHRPVRGLRAAVRSDEQAETSQFPMFRAETREMNFNAATIVFTGKCKATEPIVTRPA